MKHFEATEVYAYVLENPQGYWLMNYDDNTILFDEAIKAARYAADNGSHNLTVVRVTIRRSP
jgi:hypothetical protein